MRRRTLFTASAVVLGGLFAGCQQGPRGRRPISVEAVYPRDGDTTGLHWIVDGMGGVSDSEAQVTVDEGEDAVVLAMTAWDSSRPGEAQVALGVYLSVEITLAAPLGRRRFVRDNGETLGTQKPPGR